MWRGYCIFFEILDRLKSVRMACGPEKHVYQNASPAGGWRGLSVRFSFGFVKLQPIHICAGFLAEPGDAVGPKNGIV